MAKKVTEDGRYRIFFVELYHDTEDYDYQEVVRNLKSLGEYAYITHDKDTFEDGTLKKIHDHWIVKRDNAMSGKAFYKKTGIPLKFCQEVKNERSCIRYLIHFDEIDKYHYSFDEIRTSGKYQRTVSKAFLDKESDEEILANIYNFIYDLKNKVDNKIEATYYLLQYVNSNCYDTIYKRYRNEFSLQLSSIFY